MVSPLDWVDVLNTYLPQVRGNGYFSPYRYIDEKYVLASLCSFRNGKHQYTALGTGPSSYDDVGEYFEMEKRSRDRALSICTTYIHGTSRYTLLKQLNNIGKYNQRWAKWGLL